MKGTKRFAWFSTTRNFCSREEIQQIKKENQKQFFFILSLCVPRPKLWLVGQVYFFNAAQLSLFFYYWIKGICVTKFRKNLMQLVNSWEISNSNALSTVSIITIYAPMIYTALCVMFWMRAYPLLGQVGGGWALEFKSFLGPVKWHRANRRVPFHRLLISLRNLWIIPTLYVNNSIFKKLY